MELRLTDKLFAPTGNPVEWFKELYYNIFDE